MNQELYLEALVNMLLFKGVLTHKDVEKLRREASDIDLPEPPAGAADIF